ncbi:MAG: biotin/lipoate A/B protein ligase family protein [Negativicutes bacterium]
MNENKEVAGVADWRLLLDEAADGAWNMAADEAMLLSLSAGETLPTLRFYSWSPAAVSLGYFQRAGAEIDRVVCKRQGIDVVRRLTGGRAVLHDVEVTYSLVVSEDESYIPSGMTDSYLFFSRGIVAGLARMGIIAQVKMPEVAVRSNAGTVRSAACFDAVSHYEITIGGRKVVGSAQVRKDGVLLQQGSILLRFFPERMASVMCFDDEAARMKMTAELSRRATDLSEVAGRKIGFDEAVEAVQAGIAEQCLLHLTRGARTLTEKRMIQELTRDKYSTEEWNLRR